MRAWGRDQPCVLCGERNESRDHLFFACPYSFTVWSDLGGALLRHRQDPDWLVTIAQLESMLEDRQNGILLRLCFQAIIYSLWRERNARIHHSGYDTTSQLVRRIDKLIRNRISSLSYFTNPRLGDLPQRWFAATTTQ